MGIGTNTGVVVGIYVCVRACVFSMWLESDSIPANFIVYTDPYNPCDYVENKGMPTCGLLQEIDCWCARSEGCIAVCESRKQRSCRIAEA